MTWNRFLSHQNGRLPFAVFACLVIFLVALIPKVTYWYLYYPLRLSPDAVEYLAAAGNLLATGTYGIEPGAPDAMRPVLYPLFLVPFVALQGPLPSAVPLVQCVIAALAAVVAYAVASRQGGKGAGAAAGLMCATYVPLMTFPSHFLTETLFSFLLLALILAADWLLGEQANHKPWAPAVTTGILLGLLALARPVAAPLILVVAGFVAVCQWLKGRPWVRVTGAVLVSCLVVQAPWVIRNAVTLGRFVPLTEQGTSVRLDGYWYAELMGRGLNERETRREIRQMDERYRRAVARTQYWNDYLRHVKTNFLVMIGVHPSLDIPFPFAGHRAVYSPSIVAAYHYGWNLVVSLAVMFGLVLSLLRRDLRLLQAIAIPLTLICAYALIGPNPRFQVPIFFALSAPAGVSMATGMKTLKRWAKNVN